MPDTIRTFTVYGNGLTVNYTYDEMDRVTGVSFGATPMYSYSYDGEGNLQRLVGIARNVTTTFFYDLSGRLIPEKVQAGSLALRAKQYYDRLFRS